MAVANESSHPTPKSETSPIPKVRKEKGANPLGRIDLRRMRRMEEVSSYETSEPSDITSLTGRLPKAVDRRFSMEIKIVATVPGDAHALTRAVEEHEDIEAQSSLIADEQQKGE